MDRDSCQLSYRYSDRHPAFLGTNRFWQGQVGSRWGPGPPADVWDWSRCDEVRMSRAERLAACIFSPCSSTNHANNTSPGQVWQLTLQLSRCSISLLEEWCIHSHGLASLLTPTHIARHQTPVHSSLFHWFLMRVWLAYHSSKPIRRKRIIHQLGSVVNWI